MADAEWVLELALLLLLAATLFHALRLERALGVLKRDRAVLEELVAGFNDSTRQAESGIERLRLAADGAGRQMARQIEAAQKLRDDLSFLADRSDRLAHRLETAVRSARMFADSASLSQDMPAPGLAALSPAAQAPAARGPAAQGPAAQGPAAQGPAAQGPAAQGPAIQGLAVHGAAPPISSAGLVGAGVRGLAGEPSTADTSGAMAGNLAPEPVGDLAPRLRSQAERDLMRALQAGH